MNTQHTPGPWITDDRHVHPANGLTYPKGQEPETDVIVLVDTDQHENGLLNETDKANLRLIAAAPELLAACEVAQRYIGLLPGDPNKAMDVEWDAIWQQLRAAIAKAKGETL